MAEKANKSNGLTKGKGKRKLSTQEAIRHVVRKKKTKKVKPIDIIEKPGQEIEVIPEITKDIKPLKDHLTKKELRFLELLADGENTIESAMKLAGYKTGHPNSIYYRARQIIKKYERHGQDIPNIFRDIGFGEYSVAKGIKSLANQDKSITVKCRAHEIAAKCLGMIKDAPTPAAVGIQIVFTSTQPGQVPPGQSHPLTIDLTPIKGK